ncbi:ABC transporter substrate-binding protein [Streptomyces sp. NPDC002143]
MNRFSRGPVKRNILTATAAALTLALGATACGSSSGGASGSSSAAGTVAIGLDTDWAAQGYDPAKYTNSRQFFESVYDSLFVETADGGVKPSLAEKFEYNKDKTQLTLTLRKGVTFSDGSALTAEVVKKNLDRRDEPGLLAYGNIAKGGAAEVKDVTAPDAQTVVITFAKPQPTFQDQLASSTGMIVSLKGLADAKALAAAPYGSGPYTLDKAKSVKGSKYTMERRKGYWNSSAFAYDTVVYSPVADSQARANALVSGQTDVAWLAGSTTSFVRSRGVKLASLGGSVVNFLVFDKKGTVSKPFGDIRVRQALQVAINRKDLVSGLHKGDKPTSNAFPSSSDGYDPSLNTTWAYDPAKAKKLLAEAGYAKGFSFTILTSQASQTDLEAIQKDFKAVGVDMKLKPAASTEEVFAAVNTTPLGYGPINWVDPVAVVQSLIVGGFMNTQKATDKQITEATNAAAGSTGAQRTEALTKLNTRLVEAGWLIPVYESYSYAGYNAKKVKPLTFAGNDPYPLLSSIKPAS